MLDTGNSNPIKIKTMKKNKKRFIVTGVIGAAILLLTCGLMIVNHKSSHQQMIDVLKDLAKRNNDVRSAFNPEVKYALLDSIIRMNGHGHSTDLLEAKAALALKVGKEEESVKFTRTYLTE